MPPGFAVRRGYRLGAQLAGKVVKCKQCGGQIVVGGAAPAAVRQHVAAAAGPAFGSIGDLLDDAGPGKIIAPPTILPGQTLSLRASLFCRCAC